MKLTIENRLASKDLSSIDEARKRYGSQAKEQSRDRASLRVLLATQPNDQDEIKILRGKLFERRKGKDGLRAVCNLLHDVRVEEIKAKQVWWSS